MRSLSLLISEMGQIWENCMHSLRSRGYPWAVGPTNRETLKTLGVTVQSTKIVIDAEGVIVYRAGYGKGTGKDWISVFEKLTGETPET